MTIKTYQRECKICKKIIHSLNIYTSTREYCITISGKNIFFSDCICYQCQDKLKKFLKGEENEM